MKRSKFIFVGGINGSGKSTILKKLARKERKFKVIHSSTYFMKWLALKKGDYDTLRLLPDSLVLKELDKMMRFLVKNPPSGSQYIILDAHYLNIRHGKAIEWVGGWIGLMDSLVLIKTSPQIILRRLKADFKITKRDRDIFSSSLSYAEKLRFLSFCNRKSGIFIKKLSKKFKTPYFIINNNSCLQRSVKNLKNYLELKCYETANRNRISGKV